MPKGSREDKKGHKKVKAYRILVIGAGFEGLTTAYTLAKNGYQVTVVFEASNDIVSQVAAAVWVLPTSVFTWKDRQFENKMKEWGMCSYRRYTEIADSDSTSGVLVKDFNFVFKTKIVDSPRYSAFMDGNKCLPGFRHSHHILQEKGITGPGLVDCFTIQSPFVNPDVYLKWLTKKCQSLRVQFQRRSITGLLADQIESLKKEYQVDLVVNCTGLRARELTRDKDVYPVVGAAFVCRRPDKSILDYGIDCLTHWVEDEFNAHGHVIISPRGQDSYYIGTLLTENIAPSELHANHPVIQRLLNECISVYPPLQDIIAGQQMTFKVGSRPMRKGGPRVERDDLNQSIIHNYGHCSLGSILSWGSAEEVWRIIQNSQSMSAKL